MSYNLIKRFLLGFLIGCCVILPGISGASFAVILGVYDELILNISNIFKSFKKSILFLLPIFIFIALGVIVGLLLIKGLLKLFPFSFTLLFIGLILGSIKGFINDKYIISFKGIILIIIGIFIPLIILFFSNFNKFYINLDNYFFTNLIIIFIIGIIVSITQFIPGASASSFLISIGIFTILLNRISINYLYNNPKFIIILFILLLGFIIGSFLSSIFINKIIKRLGDDVNNLYIGLSIGSCLSILLCKDNIDLFKDLVINKNYFDLILGIIMLIIGIIINNALKKYIRKE